MVSTIIALLSCALPLSAAFTVQYNTPVRRPAFSTASFLYKETTYGSTTERIIEVEKAELEEVLAEPLPELVAPVSVIKLTWEADVEQEIRKIILEKHIRADTPEEHTTTNQPLMVAVIGIPGSGKSTSCSILTGLLRDVGCLLMPFDGYHYSIDELNQKENTDDLIYRRGAPDTFNVEALKRDLESIRYSDVSQVNVPGFDHAAGDPEPDAHLFDRDEHKVVITEGLYLLHDEGGWEDIKNNFDMAIYVNADVDVCVDRLKERNKCIPGYTLEEIEARCDAVDRVNAHTVHKSKSYASLIVESAASAPSC